MQVVPTAAQQNPRYMVSADNVTRLINANGMVGPNGNQIILTSTGGQPSAVISGQSSFINVRDAAIQLNANSNILFEAPAGYIFLQAEEPLWVNAALPSTKGIGVGTVTGNAHAGTITGWDGNALEVNLPTAITGTSNIIMVTAGSNGTAAAQPYVDQTLTTASQFTINSVTPAAGLILYYRVVQI